MTVRHCKYTNEDAQIVEIDGYTVSTAGQAIGCLRRELRVMQAMWPEDMAGYTIVKRKVRK